LSTANIAFSEKNDSFRIRKDQLILAAVSHSIEDCEGRIRERNNMVLPHFHSLAWNPPSQRGPIDLGPSRPDYFVCAASSEDQKAQGLGGNAGGV
jgi:hypothetical protein